MDTLMDWLPGQITTVTLAALVCLLAIFYYYLTADYDYWSKQGVPGPKPKFFLGNLNFKEENHVSDIENCKKYGSMYGIYEGRNPALHITDPHLIRQVTIKDFAAFPFTRKMPKFKGDKVFKYFISVIKGEQWKQVRSIVSPTFTTGKLKQMTSLIDECCRNLVKKHLSKFAEGKEPFDVKRQMSCFTLDVITSCAFGISTDSMENPDSELISKAREMANPKLNKLLTMIMLLMPSLFNLVPQKLIMMKESPFDYFVVTLAKVLEHKRLQTEKRGDFLELLLEAEAENSKETIANHESKNVSQTTNNSDNHQNKFSKKVLTEELIIAQALIFLAAGHESVSTTISHCLYCIALNTEVQDKLIAEVDDILDEHKEELTYESISKLQYLDMVVSETLRLYPFSTRIDRTCVEDGYVLNGVKLRNGIVVSIPSYAIHHDPKYYPDPEMFIPERFSPEAKAERDPMTYLPFGAGPRHCVAMRFALLEVKMVVASIIRHYWVKSCQQTQVPLEFSTGFPLLQPNDVTLTVQKRH